MDSSRPSECFTFCFIVSKRFSLHTRYSGVTTRFIRDRIDNNHDSRMHCSRNNYSYSLLDAECRRICIRTDTGWASAFYICFKDAAVRGYAQDREP